MRMARGPAALLVVLALALSACAVPLEGRLLLIGGEPAAKLVLELDDGRRLELVGEMAEALRPYQHRRARIEGRLLDARGAPGLPPRFEPSSFVILGE